MSGARDLEENLLLPLEQDLAVVELARQVHQAIDVDQLLRARALHIFPLCATAVLGCALVVAIRYLRGEIRSQRAAQERISIVNVGQPFPALPNIIFTGLFAQRLHQPASRMAILEGNDTHFPAYSAKENSARDI